MKRISITLGVVLAVCMSFFISQMVVEAATGTDKVISLNTPITDNLGNSYEVDYFRFTLTQPGSVTVNLNKIVTNSGEYQFSLYGNDSSSNIVELAYGFTGTNINTNLYKQRLPAGDYFVKVQDDYRFTNADYRMTVNYVAEPEANFEKEFNDSVNSAYGISPNVVYTGNLSDSNDLDYYKFTLAEPGSVTVNLNKIVTNSGEYKLSLYAYDSSSNLVELTYGFTGTNINTNLYKQRLPAGDYFVKVQDDYPFTNADYRMTVNYVAEPGANFEKEFNDSVNSAYGISPNVVYTGNLSVSNDLDYYKFTLAQPDSVTVNLNKIATNSGEYLFSLYGYDSSSNLAELAYGFTGTNINTNLNKLQLPAGDYFVKVERYYFTNADYQLTVNSTVSPIQPSAEVVSGINRFDTAALISKRLNASANTVILTTGRNFPDALSAGPLAVQKNAPILLAEVNKIPIETLNEIDRLGASKVIILGGLGAIDSSVEATLKNLGLSVERISGATRFLTAIETAKQVRASSGQLDRAILANGYGFADALSIGSYAAKEGIPILLTAANSLSPETKTAMIQFGIKKIDIIGGELAVSKAVESQLQVMGITVSRISGASRFATSAAIAGTYFAASENAIVSNGQGFVDALAAVPLAVKQNAPILLVEKDSLPVVMSNYLGSSSIKNITITGGELAVSSTVKNQILNIIN